MYLTGRVPNGGSFFIFNCIYRDLNVEKSIFNIDNRQVFLNREAGNKLLEEVETPVKNLGFSVVEINSSTNRNRLKINMIVSGKDGVKIEDCSIVHKTIFPRLEVIYESFDVYLEVSSPGIERNFKDAREFKVFEGKAIKIMYGDSNDWSEGVIESTTENTVTIQFKQDSREIKFNDVHKCKLDYLREVRKS